MHRFLPVAVLLLVSIDLVRGEAIEIGAGRGRNWNAIKLTNDANAQINRGDLKAADQSIDAAIRADPSLWPALYTRARLLVAEGKYAEALRDCEVVLQKDSTFAPAALLRAEANMKLGNYHVALKEVNHVISIRPRQQFLAMAYNGRAWIYAACPDPALRNGRQAIQDAALACKLRFCKNSNTIDTLACAYAEMGDFDSAIRYERQAIAMGSESTYALRGFNEHLALFQQHRPARITGT